MREEEKIFAGQLFKPGHPDLKAIKLRTHNLNNDYNATYEDETEKRAQILSQIVGSMGEGSFIQGPIHFHYGVHTHRQTLFRQLQPHHSGRCACNHR